ncbi:MAG: DNRLRE domain-containing protein [Anaerolineae bacterium]|nr:DNRLRE domain-containing protein [Anaerolineae bacterium]
MPKSVRRWLVVSLLLLFSLSLLPAAHADPPSPATKSPLPPVPNAPLVPPVFHKGAAPDAVLDSIDFTAERDAWIGSGPAYRDQNRGGDQTLFVGFEGGGAEAERSLVYFNLAALPEGAVIDTATMSLALYGALGSGDMEIVVRRILSGWSETGVTWNAPPAYDNSRNWASATVGTGVRRYEWNLTVLARGWASGDLGNQGVILVGDETPRSGVFDRAFWSREASNSANRPRLQVTYDIARMNTLPAFIGATGTTIGWGAGSMGGIATWDVQTRQRTPTGSFGDWTDWRDNTPATTAQFEGAHNTVYQFRVRANYLTGGSSSWGPASGETLVDNVPPVVPTVSLPTYSGSNFTVSWSTSDDGSGVQDYNFEVYDNGVYVGVYNTAATSQPFETGINGHLYSFRVRARDRAGNVSDWSPAVGTRVDTEPPSVSIQAGGRYQLATIIVVDWAGQDAGIGVASYDVQVREEDGPWTDWRLNTTDTEGVYFGVAGRTYRFRVRARDGLGNLSRYTPDDAAVVTSVRASVAGRVLGNRGQPIAGALVTSQPAAVNPDTRSGGAGGYTLYLNDTATRRLSVSHPDYLAPAPMTVLGGTGQQEGVTLYLRPGNDTVVNGGFEDGLTGWTVSGDTQTGAGHSGEAGARLGVGASLRQRVSVPTGGSSALAFLYLATSEGGSTLQVRFENLSTGQPPVTYILTPDGRGGWQQATFDLAGLAGALFDLRLSVASGGPVLLDEVSLGAAQPTVYLTWFPLVERGATLGRRPVATPQSAPFVAPDPKALPPIDLSKTRP